MSDADLPQHLPVMVDEATAAACTPSAAARTWTAPSGSAGTRARCSTRRRPRHRRRSRSRQALAHRRPARSSRSARACDSCTPTTAISTRCSTRAGVRSSRARSPTSASRRCSSTRDGPRVQLPPRRAARHAHGPVAGRDRGRTAGHGRRTRRWPTSSTSSGRAPIAPRGARHRHARATRAD